MDKLNDGIVTQQRQVEKLGEEVRSLRHKIFKAPCIRGSQYGSSRISWFSHPGPGVRHTKNRHDRWTGSPGNRHAAR